MAEDELENRRFPLLLGMVILALLLLLIAVGFPAWRYYKHSADRNATLALVQKTATAIMQYPVKTWTWDAATPPAEKIIRTAFLWDLNRDGQLDGTPSVAPSPTTDDGFTPELIASGYLGFHAMVKPTIATRFLSTHRQVIDAWGHPLRIAFAPEIYGAAWFGLWSKGPDGIDGTADDIMSWVPTP